jgi:hypothetical protein
MILRNMSMNVGSMLNFSCKGISRELLVKKSMLSYNW